PDPGRPRRALSFLTEDGSVPPGSPEDGCDAGPLSSTRRSLLEQPELGDGCGWGEPPLCLGCPPEPPSIAPWPHVHPALPPQPLASSTLLSARDELGEGPQSQPPSLPPGASNSPGSSPTVLLVPGDCGHPQDSLSGARGSLSSSPMVLLALGDRGHPQDSPSDARGFPRGASSPRVLEGGSGWQDPSGTHQPLLATTVEMGSPAVPLSPSICSTRCSEEHPEDEEQGQAPTERHSPGTEATTSPEDAAGQDGQRGTVPLQPLSDEALRRRLRALGDDPGPVTELTRPELVAALRTGHVPDCTQDELVLAQQFDRPDRSRHWREGLLKSSFNYLLLDPRTTQNLPLRSHRLSPAECFRTFVKAIFYVGKGTRARPYCHLGEALSQHRAGTQK
ncbi:ANKL1 protein, partial [Nyctibius bracteatus]|nr:ANKL1 protein [Nyctibius bracteatus]